MARRRQVPGPGGKKVWGTEIPFRTGAEHFNEYLLDDGTVIKIKLVATNITKIDDLTDADGNPVYNVQSNNVVAISVPEDLKEEEEEEEEDDG